MIVAFWSPLHGQCGTTTATLAMAVQTAVSQNMKILVTQSHKEVGSMEHYLIAKEEKAVLQYNMEQLRRLVRNGRCSPDMIKDYTLSILRGSRMDLMQPFGEEETNQKAFLQVLQQAQAYYDLVFVDLHNGSGNYHVRTLLQEADLIVVVLNQNQHVLEILDQMSESVELDWEKKRIYCINHYHTESRFTRRKVARKLNAEVLTLAESLPLREACNQGSAVDYLLRLQNESSMGEQKKLRKNLQEGAKVILKKLEEERE